MNLFLKLALYVLCACCGYFIGCHNLAHILSKRRGFDIRAVGSNNPGTSNTVITMGWKAGVMVGAHDIFKAFIPAVLAGLLLPQLVCLSLPKRQVSRLATRIYNNPLRARPPLLLQYW